MLILSNLRIFKEICPGSEKSERKSFRIWELIVSKDEVNEGFTLRRCHKLNELFTKQIVMISTICRLKTTTKT